MGAAVQITFRGLMWALSAMGLGYAMGGDTIEHQTIVQETTIFEKIMWSLLLCCMVVGLFLLVKLAIKKYF